MQNANTEEKQDLEYQQMLRREKRETDRIKDKFTVMSSEQVDQLLNQVANGGHTSEAD
jgi:hypothetical protein